MFGTTVDDPTQPVLLIYEHSTLTFEVVKVISSAGTSDVVVQAYIPSTGVDKMILGMRYQRSGLYEHVITNIDVVAVDIEYFYLIAAQADPESWQVGRSFSTNLRCFVGKSSDAHTIRAYFLDVTTGTVKISELYDSASTIQPLNLQVNSAGGFMTLLYDDTSTAYLAFTYLTTGVYWHQWNNLLPAASSYVINGDLWSTYDAYGSSSLGFTYHGTQVGHKTYTRQVSAFTFNRTNQNCLDQSTSN